MLPPTGGPPSSPPAPDDWECDDPASQLGRRFAVLANDDRRAIANLLLLQRADGRRGMSITEVAEALELTRFCAGRHLKLLRDAGMVQSTTVGQSTINELTLNPFLDLEDWILSITLRAAAS